MADSKTAKFFSKTVTKQASRAREKVLQKLGKADETKDRIFDEYVQNVTVLQTSSSKLQKEVKQYLSCLKAMSAASKSFYESLRDVYESNWTGHEQLNSLIETMDTLWEDYVAKMSDQVYSPIQSYTGQFSDTKARIAKRGRKLVDYDSARHNLDSSLASKKKEKDDIKIAKSQEQFNEAKRRYEDFNNELLEELPMIYDGRVSFYSTTFQSACSVEEMFHTELGKVNRSFASIMDALAQEAANGAYNSRRPSRGTDVLEDTSASSSQEGGGSLASYYEVAMPEERPQQPSPAPLNRTNPTYDLEEPGGDDEDDRYQTAKSLDGLESAEGATYKSLDVQEVPTKATIEETEPEANEAVYEDPEKSASLGKPPRPQPSPATAASRLYQVRSTHQYNGMDSDELSFEKGELINVVSYDDPEDQDDGWLMGIRESDGTKGVFPENFTQRI